MRSNLSGLIASVAFLMVAVLCLAGCGSSTASTSAPPPAIISVSVTAPSGTVQGAQVESLTAAVVNDQNSAGVTWSVSGGGTLSGQTTTSATYTAPAVTTAAQTITVTATSKADTSKSGSVTLTVPGVATSLTGTISGVISVIRNCDTAYPPPITVTLNTTPARTTTTSGTGTFSFANVPYGSYTVTPSIAGVSAVFHPASQSVNLGGSAVQATFGAAFNYTISGTVNYAGSHTGPIYIGLGKTWIPGDFTFSGIGTEISSSGTFTIRGVQPGACELHAWMDKVGQGVLNANNPSGTVSGVTVSNANLTGINVTLTDPAAVTLSAAPTIRSVQPFSQGAYLFVNGIIGNNTFPFQELPESYTLQWSTSSTFSPLAGSKSFPVNGGVGFWFLPGLSNGTPYYFRLQGVAGSSTSPWSTVYGPVTIGAPAGAYTVSGSINFTGTPTGPLYIVFTDHSNGNYYVCEIAHPANIQPYTIQLPTSSSYEFYAFVDQNNDGMEDVGDFGHGGRYVAISGSTTEDMTLFSGNSQVRLTTFNSQWIEYAQGSSQANFLDFIVVAGVKQPVAATLVSGPNIITSQDLAQMGQLALPLEPFGAGVKIWSDTPRVGDAYGVQLTYSDGSSEIVTATVSGAVGSFGANPSPVGTGTNLTPTFTWTDPVNASNYTYDFYAQGSVVSSWLWEIPALPIPTNNFSSSITSVPWGVDPTGGGSVIPVSSMTNGIEYNWVVEAYDGKGNSSQQSVYYRPGYTGLSIPSPNPNTLGSGTVGQSYTGTIVASGGTAPYSFTVYGLTDGLSYSSSGGTLTISGTPLAAGTVTFQATVQDSTSTTYGPVTYSINVAAH
jgi:hypothetical protein